MTMIVVVRSGQGMSTQLEFGKGTVAGAMTWGGLRILAVSEGSEGMESHWKKSLWVE